MEPWIETATGDRFWYTTDDFWGINIEDIALSLSKMCRFTGHCNKFYSVAEHSVYVSLLLPKKKALYGLLHDASEAYLADIASPVKQLLPEYKVLEEKIMDRVAVAFGLPQGFWKDTDIKRADWSQLRVEAKTLLPSGGADWYFPPDLKNSGVHPQCLSPEDAYNFFMTRWDTLTNDVDEVSQNQQAN